MSEDGLTHSLILYSAALQEITVAKKLKVIKLHSLMQLCLFYTSILSNLSRFHFYKSDSMLYMKSSFAKTDNSVFNNLHTFFFFLLCIAINLNQTAVRLFRLG